MSVISKYLFTNEIEYNRYKPNSSNNIFHNCIIWKKQEWYPYNKK